MKLLLGALAMLLVIALGTAALAWSGTLSVSALAEEGAVDDFLGYAARRSIARHADDVENPRAGDPDAIAAGLVHYRQNCLVCHAAPGVAASEIAAGLRPAAPLLNESPTQRLTDGELHWIVSHGIRMTGMPAFSPTHDEDEIWQIVAFVRHLDSLTDEERAQLTGQGAGEKPEEEHHHDIEGGGNR